MHIKYSKKFKKNYKKLNPSQQEELKSIIKHVQDNPNLGQLKTGDLKTVRVYKHTLGNQLFLISYTTCIKTDILTFRTFGTHENFYRDLKKYLNK
tara:strand:+ start:2276 stop:2560 length:285 start_codon:yes stop_codon:yes gene_type:complete